jgi:DNA primase catalytic core
MYVTNLQDLLSNFKIEEVIKEYIPSWDGKSKIKCPFHEEKTPSFSISPAKNLASCFGGCDLRLNPVTFIQESDGCTWIEAVVKCAKIHRLEVKYDNRKLSPEQQLKYQKKQEELLSMWMLNKMVAQSYMEKTYGQKIPASFDFKHNDQVRSLSKKTIEKFEVCMSPNSWDFITSQFDKKQLVDLGLIKNKQNGGYYDVFRERQMFPIHGHGNQIVGFAGRATSSDIVPKYLNSPESKIYKKKDNLYGLYPQANYIRKTGMAYLAEGYWDVLTPYDQGFEGIVATCGTALTKEQIKLLKRFAKSVCYLADNDSDKKTNAGLEAVKKGTPELIKAGIQTFVSILPDKQDPDSFMREVGYEDFAKYVDANMQDAFLWTIQEQWESATIKDGFAQATIQEYVIGVLVHLSDETIVDYFARKACSITGISIAAFRTALRDAQAKFLASNATPGTEVNDSGYTPEQQQSVTNYGMYEQGKQIYCTKGDGGSTSVSNFVVRPLFHLFDKEEPKRIFELENMTGQRRVIDTDTANLVSMERFKNIVEAVGNYVFSGNANQYNRLKRKIYDTMQTCYGIKTLGFHIDGFYAWGNGIYTREGDFIPVNKYGIVECKKKQYFLPAMSEIYKGADNLYDEEKNFLYVESKVSFEDWAKLFCQVHGDHGKIALCFYLAAIFRSHIQTTVKVPLLNLFGQPGTGKSLLAENLICMFVKQPKGFNIHAGTKVGLFNKLMSVRDGVLLLEEYKNSIHSSKIEACKSIYDNIGRERGQKSSSRNITTPIYSTAILAGQELPTADPALFTRCVSLSFSKTKYSVAEKEQATKLSNLRGKVSSITAGVTTHRELIVKNFVTTFNEKFTEVRNYCAKKKRDIDARIINNNAVLLATHKVMSEVLEFPFDEKEIFKICTDNMFTQQQQIGDENEVAVFFSMFEYLATSKFISEGVDYHVKTDDKTNKRILSFRFPRVYGLYMNHHRQQHNKTGIPKSSLQHYLKTHHSFLRYNKSIRFEGGVTSGFQFDYGKLKLSLIDEQKSDSIQVNPEPYSKNESIHPENSKEWWAEQEAHLNEITKE